MTRDYRKQSIKNGLALSLVFALIFLLISACTPKPQPPQKSTVTPTRTRLAPTRTATLTPTLTPQPTSAIKVEPSGLRGARVQFWHPWNGEAGKAILALIREFNAGNEWGILVEGKPFVSLDDLEENLQASFLAQDAPDLAVGYEFQAQSWDQTWDLVDLNKYIDDPDWGLPADQQAGFEPLFFEEEGNQDKRVGLPAQRSGSLLYYNQTWAKELGYSTPPGTPEDFRRQACAATQANLQDADPGNDKTGGWLISTRYSPILSWFYAFGSDVMAPSASQKVESPYRFDTPEVRDAFTFLRRLYDANCAWLSETPYPEDDFAARRALFATGSLTGLPAQAEAMARSGNRDSWTVLPFPSPGGEAAITVYGPSYSIFTSDQTQQLATWLFLKWLLEPENQTRLVQATGTFPLSSEATDLLSEYESQHPLWAEALKLLPLARGEPTLESWSLVRWAVSDAATQLFRSYFSVDQVPGLAKLLDQTAADLHTDPTQNRAAGTFTPVPSQSATPSVTWTLTPSPARSATMTPTPTKP